ncbi:2TM domain-containing protein [Membranicola marinus]|uniref:2TM domain-containing protein n=1 Tax=Membranihabitans marinus TaxID=1227546 RepID=A0A953HWF5_9BACT|nr:hypothetical protein [Membranihabitans marinus]MBY5959750.1 2TM domain-containing protein [Membranihabitans marinus]
MNKDRHQHRRKERTKRAFKKSLVSYVLMLLFFGFLFLRVGVPSFVFFIVAIPMTISIIHKYIDTFQNDEAAFSDDDIPYESRKSEEEWTDDTLDLEDFKTLKNEWKDSDFV